MLLAVALFGVTQAATPHASPRPAPTPPPVLDGIVQDPRGQAVEKALVVASCSMDRARHPPLSTRTDAQGRFRLERVGPGPCDLQVEAGGWAPARLERVRPGPPLKIALEAGRVLEGTIRDGGTGLPIADARVEASTGDVAPSWEPEAGIVAARTDADGRYRLAGLGRGVYTVTASGRGYGRARKTGVVAPRRVDLVLIPGASVSGTIVGPDQKGVPGVVLRLEREGERGRPTPLLARTDARGAFEVPGVTRGRYVLSCWRAGFGALLVSGVQVEGAGDAPLSLTLLPGTAVTGRLVDEKERPVAGRVALEELDGRPVPRALAEVLRAEAGPDGRFRLEGVPQGSHALGATAPGHAPKRVEFDADVRETAELGDVVLEVGLAIRGRVRDKAGLPLAGALVHGFRRGPSVAGAGLANAEAEGDGTFVLAGLSEGTYELLASAPGYGSATTQAEPGSEVDLVLSAGGAIAGQVVDEAGRPVEGFSVEAEAAGDQTTFRKGDQDHVAAPDGRFRLEDLDAGVFILRVTAPDHPPAVVPDLTVAAGATTDAGRIRLGSGGVLRGSVWDKAGAPVAGAAVLVFGAGARWETGTEPQATTDAGGSFEIRGVGPGSVQAIARHPDFAEAVVGGLEIDPAKGPTETRIVLARGARLEGLARTREGGAVPGAEVRVWFPEGGTFWSRPPTSIPLQPDGSFAADHLAPGTAEVALMAGDASRRVGLKRESVTLRDGETTFVDLSSREILVSGHVTRDGLAAPRLRVSFQSEAGATYSYSSSSAPSTPSPGPQRLTGITGEGGGYELLVPSAGRYRAGVETLDGRTTYGWKTAEVPDVEAWSLDLDLAGSPVTGVVVDQETGAPLPGAWLLADRKGGERAAGSAQSGSDGRFELVLADGDYRLSASAEGYASGAIDVAAPASDLRLPLSRGGSLKGRVVDAAGHGVPNLAVRVAWSEGGGPNTRINPTLSDGSFEFTGLPSRPLALLAGSGDAGFAFRSGLGPGDQDLVLTLRPGGRVRVLVRDSEGQPVAGAWTGVTSVAGAPVRGDRAPTDAQGLGEIAAPAAVVEIEAFKEDRSGSARVGVPEGGVAAVEITLTKAAAAPR